MTEDFAKWEERHPGESLPVATSPNAVVMAAISKGYEPAFIEKIMDLQERFEKNEAKKAFHKAMAGFKANPPDIEKDKTVSFGAGKAAYTHASLSNVSKKINMALSAHGLSAVWATTQNNGSITVICTITHELGHSDSTSLTASPDTSGSKNPIQAIGSTISYLERYTLLALTGLATRDMDDDGQKGGDECLSVDQQTEINDLLKETKADVKKFLAWAKAESVETILESKYKPAVSMLKAKQAQQQPKDREPGEEG